MIELDERLMALITDEGSHHRTIRGAPFWGGSEAGFIVTERDGLFDVAYWSRGRTNPPGLTGATLPIVEVYMTSTFGNSWRMQQGWDVLRIAEADDTPPPEFEVFEQADGSGGLIVHSNPPIRLREMFNRRQATDMAFALSVPFGDLIASYRDPDGLPCFPQR